MPRKKKITAEEYAEYVTDLRGLLDSATKDHYGLPMVWCVVKHVTRSGMSRSISTFAVIDGQPYNLDYRVSKILGWPTDENNGGVKVAGCGMDMGFHLVYSLACALYDSEESGYRLHRRWL